MTALASMVMVDDADTGIAVSVNDGAVKVFACQSSKKKPMVPATGGSTGGTITTVSTGGGGGGGVGSSFVLFLQLNRPATKNNIRIYFFMFTD